VKKDIMTDDGDEKFQRGLTTPRVSAALICGFNPRFPILKNDPVLKPISSYLCTKDAE
jgi:hypothetical protein